MAIHDPDLLVANPLAAAELRGQLVEFELARGKFQEALAEAEALSATTSDLGIPAVAARCHYLLGRALAAVGNDTALRELNQARAMFVELAMPYEPRVQACSCGLTCREAGTAQRIEASRCADAAALLDFSGSLAAPRKSHHARGEILPCSGKACPTVKSLPELFITPKTVEHHVGHVLSKLI